MSIRRHLAATVAVIAVAGGIVAFVLAKSSVSYTCQIDFVYEDGKCFEACGRFGKIVRVADDDNIAASAELVANMFADKEYPFPMAEMVRRCKDDDDMRNEDTNRLARVLSTLSVEMLEKPCADFAFLCRVSVSDVSDRNLCEIAQCCMEMVKSRTDYDNNVLAYKAALAEFQHLERKKRRIKEIETAVASGSASEAEKEELTQEKDDVCRLQRRIDDIRRESLAIRGKRVTSVSCPRVIRNFRLFDKEAAAEMPKNRANKPSQEE